MTSPSPSIIFRLRHAAKPLTNIELAALMWRIAGERLSDGDFIGAAASAAMANRRVAAERRRREFANG